MRERFPRAAGIQIVGIAIIGIATALMDPSDYFFGVAKMRSNRTSPSGSRS